MGMISGFIQGLRPPALNGLGKLAQRRWRQAREVAAYAEFTPGEVGPGAVSPALPASDLAPENVRAAVLADAAEILRGKFSVFRGQVLSVHTPPIWDRDYLAGQEAPATARSAQLEITKLPGNMDVRVVWELNRWTQLVRLAQAFHLSRDEHFRRTIIEWLENWEQQNPVGCGWNWTRVTEAALRLINLTWIDALCGLPEALLSKLLPPHVWWVHRYHEVGFAEEEDSLAAVSALICVIARWPQAELWSEAMESLQVRFAAEIEEQFAADGVHRSQSLHYHLLACELCWHAWLRQGWRLLRCGQ
jgi:hypothetical protein